MIRISSACVPAVLLSCAFVAACTTGSSTIDEESVTNAATSPAGNRAADGSKPSGLDITQFADGALQGDPRVVDCTLSDGTQSSCYEIVTTAGPGRSVGPFCPQTIDTDASEAGIWLDGSGTVYDLDGEFIVELPNLYGTADTMEDWILYDENGVVRVTDTEAACRGAAVPNVADELNHYCVECSLDYFDGGVSQTFLIPVIPVPDPAPDPGGRVPQAGVALDGTQLAGPAPVDAILGNYTIAAFDDCGGHINPFEGYHYHAALGCSDFGEQADGHASLLGYAMDGYGIHALNDADGEGPGELDACRGQTDASRGYHYHAASAGENMFIPCYHGLTVQQEDDHRGPPGGPGGRRGGPPPEGASERSASSDPG